MKIEWQNLRISPALSHFLDTKIIIIRKPIQSVRRLSRYYEFYWPNECLQIEEIFLENARPGPDA